MKNKLTHIAIFLVLLAPGCRNDAVKPMSEEEIRKTKEAMIGANRIMVKKDEEKIRSYVRRNNMPLQVSATGLWYAVDSVGLGGKAKTGQIATLKYKSFLIDGTPCYSSDETGPKQFTIGQGGVESGLEEGILMLRKGDKATFIMPPHLAQGFTGDGDKIPQRAILVYEVELINLEP
jgi:FKBP-type peptidyl-prolyl cis-trans isomerase